MTRSATEDPRPGDVLSIDLDLLDDNPFQPRKAIDPTKLAELAASIKHSGQIQAISVRYVAPGRYQIAVGHRRAAAFRLLRAEATTESGRRPWKLIRAQVMDLTDAEMATVAYAENAKREDLTLLEEAEALARIRELGGHSTSAQVAQATQQPERRVRRLLRLFTAPKVVKDAVSRGLMVEAAEPGEAPRKEHRRVDLMAALEFTRLHEHHSQHKPKTADERTTTAMARSLKGNWGFRRIQAWVEAAINGTSPADPITDTHRATAATAPPARDPGGADERARFATAGEPEPNAGDESGRAHEPRDVCSSSSDRVSLYLSRLKAASRAQLEAAKSTLDDVRQLVDAQLQLKGGEPGEA